MPITATVPMVLSALANVATISEIDTRYETTPKRDSVEAKIAEPTIDLSTLGTTQVSGDLTRTLHFFSPPRYGSPPRFLVAHPNGSGIKNFGTSPINVTIRDIRNKEHRFHLALHSFKPLQHLSPLPYPLELKDSSVISTINTSATDIIRQHVSSPNQITIFSSNLLKAANPIGAPFPITSHPLQIDQTPGAAILRAKRHLPPSVSSQIATGALSLRIINIFRPILAPSSKVSDHQLCVAESLPIADDDLVAVEHVYPDRVGQTYAVRHASGQKYWYWSGMDNTEGMVVQVYDSLLGCDPVGVERMIRGPTGFFKLMPKGWEEKNEAEWLVIRALVVG
ncbi:hypothetical protein ABW20_dc0101737 [Dactylellina cionopaga]|nr:hypothetical protein ABW20_dc0101737 [Dactylellina cionopaga]